MGDPSIRNSRKSSAILKINDFVLRKNCAVLFPRKLRAIFQNLIMKGEIAHGTRHLWNKPVR